jgi:hypothetical protein
VDIVTYFTQRKKPGVLIINFEINWFLSDICSERLGLNLFEHQSKHDLQFQTWNYNNRKYILQDIPEKTLDKKSFKHTMDNPKISAILDT